MNKRIEDRQIRREVSPVMIRPRDWMAATGMTHGETYRHLDQGRLRGVKVGRAWYIHHSELTEFFERMNEAA